MKITNTSVYNMEQSIVASGFPMLSQDPTNDWNYNVNCVKEFLDTKNENYSENAKEGLKHFNRAVKLGNTKAGEGHSNFLKGILVTFNVTSDKVFFNQFARYNFQDTISSQSFMHRLTKLEIDNSKFDFVIINRFQEMISYYTNNYWENEIEKREYFEHLVTNAPCGIELTAHIYTNYLQLKTMYHQRKNHKRESWSVVFKTWCENLPYFKQLVLNEKA